MADQQDSHSSSDDEQQNFQVEEDHNGSSNTLEESEDSPSRNELSQLLPTSSQSRDSSPRRLQGVEPSLPSTVPESDMDQPPSEVTEDDDFRVPETDFGSDTSERADPESPSPAYTYSRGPATTPYLQESDPAYHADSEGSDEPANAHHNRSSSQEL